MTQNLASGDRFADIQIVIDRLQEVHVYLGNDARIILYTGQLITILSFLQALQKPTLKSQSLGG